MSASFYLPDSPSNPKPGVLYLRHVGFLGAQPPSVKGLKQVSFSEQEEGVVEFADWQAITNASLWGKLRDFLIARFQSGRGRKVPPEWQLNSLREEAYRDTLSQDAAGAQFSETGPGPSSASNEESSMTKEEIEALQEENRRLKQQALLIAMRVMHRSDRSNCMRTMWPLQKNWSQRAVWLPAPPPWWLPCWMPSPVATSRWSLLRGKPHRWPPPFVHCSPTGSR